MRNPSPIYNLLHQEIKACADHLLELGQKQDCTPEQDGEHILNRLLELHQFANKIRSEEHYLSLSDLKNYLENTMLGYQDDQKHFFTMRLSEVVSLLGAPPEPGIEYKPSMVRSLTKYFVRHFLEEIKPGKPLFQKLHAIKKIH